MATPSYISWWRQRQSTISKVIESNVNALVNEQIPKIQQYMQQIAKLTGEETQKSARISTFMALLEIHGPVRLIHLLKHALENPRKCSVPSCAFCHTIGKYEIRSSEIQEFIHILNEYMNKKSEYNEN